MKNKGLIIKAAASIAAIVFAASGLSACGTGAASSSSATSASNAKTRTIVAVTGGGPAPFVFKDADGNVSGQNVELTEAIFAKLPQYKLEWKTAEFSALFTGLDAGRYQLAVNNLSKTKEREQKYTFTYPIYQDKYVAVVNKASGIKAINTLDDLAGKKVLVCASGCNISLALKKYNDANPSKASKLVYTQNEGLDTIRQTENGTADVYFLDRATFGYLKKKGGLDTKALSLGKKAQSALSSDSYSYLVLPKGETQLRDDINKAFKEVVKDGTSKKIDVKWFGADQTPDASVLK